MAKSLYGAYTAAGKASGAYKSSLYDIENVGYEKEASARMFEIGEQQRENVVGTITEGISLASNIYEGFQSKKKFGEAKTAVQTSMAKSAYGESVEGMAKGATEWGKLGEEDRSKWMGKFTPGSKPQKWHEKLFGAEKQWRFGDEGVEKGGKDLAQYYSKSEILAEGTLSKATRLSQRTGSYTPAVVIGAQEPEPESPDEVGDLEEQSGVSEWETRRQEMNIPEMGSQWPGRSKQQSSGGEGITPAAEGEGYGETQGFGFGSNFLNQSGEDLTMGQANKRFLEGGGQAGGAFEWRGRQIKSW